jgi:hypothetical protein
MLHVSPKNRHVRQHGDDELKVARISIGMQPGGERGRDEKGDQERFHSTIRLRHRNQGV